jgi:hypothetical protein
MQENFKAPSSGSSAFEAFGLGSVVVLFAILQASWAALNAGSFETIVETAASLKDYSLFFTTIAVFISYFVGRICGVLGDAIYITVFEILRIDERFNGLSLPSRELSDRVWVEYKSLLSERDFFRSAAGACSMILIFTIVFYVVGGRFLSIYELGGSIFFLISMLGLLLFAVEYKNVEIQRLISFAENAPHPP